MRTTVLVKRAVIVTLILGVVVAVVLLTFPCGSVKPTINLSSGTQSRGTQSSASDAASTACGQVATRYGATLTASYPSTVRDVTRWEATRSPVAQPPQLQVPSLLPSSPEAVCYVSGGHFAFPIPPAQNSAIRSVILDVDESTGQSAVSVATINNTFSFGPPSTTGAPVLAPASGP